METGGMDLWDNIIQYKYPPVGKKPDWDVAVKAIKHMVKYNKKDVDLVIDLYNELKPHIDTPNRMLYEGNYDGCPACGSKAYRKHGYAYTKAGRYQRYACLNEACGKKFQDTHRVSGAIVK